MGMRSKNYLVIKPGHELAADAAKYLKSSLEERTGEGALYAWESNFTPMWARDAGVGNNVGDLREEAAIQGFLSSLPRDAFYLKRAGAECGARGTWSDHPFSIHPVVIDVDTDYAGLVGTELPGQQNAHTGRKKQLTVALALTHMEGRLGSDESLREWIHLCLNCNTNNIVADVVVVDSDAQSVQALRALQARVAAYDATLQGKEVSPSGDDYEALVKMFRDMAPVTDPKIRAVDTAAEELLKVLDHSGVLESASVQRKAYALRSAVVHALGDAGRIAAADQSLEELIAVDVDAVADDVLERGIRYGFRQDADSVREAVRESSELLSIELADAHVARACERILQAQQSQRDRDRA